MDWRDPELRRQARAFGLGAGGGFVAGALLVALLVWQSGTLSGWKAATYRDPVSMLEAQQPDEADTPVATTGSGAATPVSPEPVIGASPRSAGELADRDLLIPVEGVAPDALVRSFDDERGGNRRHEAIDILAPRNTPVRAVEDGRIARLFYSKAGGITIYQFDPSEQYCYYYAHLERYADGLREGARVRKGDVIAYVGVSGNAPRNTPHLHFAVFRLTDAKRWWEGTPLDPYEVLR